MSHADDVRKEHLLDEKRSHNVHNIIILFKYVKNIFDQPNGYIYNGKVKIKTLEIDKTVYNAYCLYIHNNVVEN
jgi:hypothetical protein